MSTAPDLPLEVVENIVGYLYIRKIDNPASMVCRTWLAACRRYVFASVRLELRRRDRFLDLLQQNSLPNISTFVTRMYLVLSPEDDPQELNLPIMRNMFGMLEAVRSVMIDLHNGYRPWQPIQDSFIYTLRNLQKLDLQRLRFEQSDELQLLLSNTPQLESLSMIEVRWNRPSGRQPFNIPPLSHLSDIRLIAISGIPSLLDWFSRSPIRAAYLDYHAGHSFGNFLQKTGASLRVLALPVPQLRPLKPGLPATRPISMSGLTNLESLRILHVPLAPPIAPDFGLIVAHHILYSKLIDELAQAHAPLREIIFDLGLWNARRPNPDGYLDAVQWDRLRLSLAQLHALRSVAFEIGSGSEHETGKNAVRPRIKEWDFGVELLLRSPQKYMLD